MRKRGRGRSSERDARRAADALAAAEERAATATALFVAVARLHDARGRADVFSAIGEIAAGCFGTPSVAVYLPDPAIGRLALAHRAGPQVDAPPEGPPAEGLAERAARERRTVLGPERHPGARDVAVPLPDAAEAGALLVHSLPLDGPEPSPALRQRLEIVARHLGIALAGARD